MSASSSLTTSMSDSSQKLCIACETRPYDLICTCAGKFCFTCIHTHVEQLDIEFHFVRNELGQRLLQLEQTIDDNKNENAKTIIENWKRKRLQDIQDIADNALDQIQQRENANCDVPPFRVEYNSLWQESDHVVHEHLTSIHSLQQRVLENSNQLGKFPEPLRDDLSLDTQLHSKLNSQVCNQTSTTDETEPIVSSPITSTNTSMNIEPISSSPVTAANENIEPDPTTNENPLMNTEPIIPNPTRTSNEKPRVESTTNYNSHETTHESADGDEFEAGQTVHIQRRNPITISVNNDRHVGTICCHENQLLYNDYNQSTRNARLILIPDIGQPTTRQTINWTQPSVTIGGGDDDWIQDIAYSSRLKGYLLLNRSRLRLLHDDTHQLDEFYEFPDRSMKRVTCDDNYIYLISAAGITAQNGDEIIIMSYQKEEKVCKTFRDIILSRNHRMNGLLVGEISDLAVSPNGQIIVSHRLERRKEVGICVYNVTNEGNEWSCIKQLLLNECWHDNLSYTPRAEWCEKLNCFILVEYMTGHLIMLEQNGQVKGECRFPNVEDRQESPLNLTVSTNDWLCVRYLSSINLHRIEYHRF